MMTDALISAAKKIVWNAATTAVNPSATRTNAKPAMETGNACLYVMQVVVRNVMEMGIACPHVLIANVVNWVNVYRAVVPVPQATANSIIKNVVVTRQGHHSVAEIKEKNGQLDRLCFATLRRHAVFGHVIIQSAKYLAMRGEHVYRKLRNIGIRNVAGVIYLTLVFKIARQRNCSLYIARNVRQVVMQLLIDS
jgi:hypothetical protein